MPESDLPPVVNAEASACIAGVVDCMFAFGVILANSGIITREDLARGFDMVAEQQERQRLGETPSRTAVPRMLAALFRVPTYDGLRVVEGGMSDAPGA
jgi:hypothetical protein